MRILLINPPRFNGHSIVREMRCVGITSVSIFPPIEFAYLAGHLRKYAEVKIIDANALNQGFEYIGKEINEFRPQAVIFSASLPSFSADAQVAKIAKKIDKNIKTILLESHVVPVMPGKIKQTFPEIDHLVILRAQVGMVGVDEVVEIGSMFDLELFDRLFLVLGFRNGRRIRRHFFGNFGVS